MIRPIGNLSPSAPPSVNTQDLLIAKQLKTHLDGLAGGLQDLLRQPELSQEGEFLNRMKAHITSLNEVIAKINPR